LLICKTSRTFWRAEEKGAPKRFIVWRVDHLDAFGLPSRIRRIDIIDQQGRIIGERVGRFCIGLQGEDCVK